MRTDVHCHVFNKDILSRWLRILIAVGEMDAPAPQSDDLLSEINIQQGVLRRIQNFIKIGTLPDSISIYDKMLEVYKNEYRCVPLMMDLSYISTKEEFQEFYAELMTDNHLLSVLKIRVGDLEARVQESKAVHALEKFNLVRTALKEVEELKVVLSQKIGEEEIKALIPVFNQKKGFQTQIQQVSDLKDKYKDRALPFLGVDPRRPDILAIVKENVGPGKTFHGVKLYPPIGFSPTDPVLMNDKGLYKHCSDNNIPVTSHCSFGGFATYANNTIVSGHVYNRTTQTLQEVTNKTVHFENKIVLHPKAAIEERADILNHPMIWAKVVDAYPGLHLNLAHLGGVSADWRRSILAMMKSENNLYSDLACHDKEDILQDIRSIVFNDPASLAASRVMYGSDYYLLLLFKDSLNEYVASFKNVFGDADVDRMAIVNTKRFLFV
jgi:predicted TIM-barrel fold metal-dependent hydrolase